ncbi:MAG: HD domain-containing protein [Treponema sp.]|nr:HD domain-containing protein [Treponema sp.]
MDFTYPDFVSSHDVRLDQQFHFVIEIDKMTHILRRTMLIDGSRRENDAEHSWHIAVMALLFSEYAKDTPDVSHAIKMLVVHDLIEIYAGDTFAYDKSGNETKAQREQEAADKLFALLPEEQGREIRTLWEEFDAMTTADARYANCLDRIQPFLHNTLTQGHTWKEGKVHKDDVLARMEIVRTAMPKVWPWVMENVEKGIERGWIVE